MRTCPSCERLNHEDREFCDCGEYLQWEPTGFTPWDVRRSPAVAQPPPAEPQPPAADAPVAPFEASPHEPRELAAPASGTPAYEAPRHEPAAHEPAPDEPATHEVSAPAAPEPAATEPPAYEPAATEPPAYETSAPSVPDAQAPETDEPYERPRLQDPRVGRDSGPRPAGGDPYRYPRDGLVDVRRPQESAPPGQSIGPATAAGVAASDTAWAPRTPEPSPAAPAAGTWSAAASATAWAAEAVQPVPADAPDEIFRDPLVIEARTGEAQDLRPDAFAEPVVEEPAASAEGGLPASDAPTADQQDTDPYGIEAGPMAEAAAAWDPAGDRAPAELWPESRPVADDWEASPDTHPGSEALGEAPAAAEEVASEPLVASDPAAGAAEPLGVRWFPARKTDHAPEPAPAVFEHEEPVAPEHTEHATWEDAAALPAAPALEEPVAAVSAPEAELAVSTSEAHPAPEAELAEAALEAELAISAPELPAPEADLAEAATPEPAEAGEPRIAISLDVAPRRRTGRRSGKFRVTVANEGDVPVAVALDALAGDDGVRSSFAPARLEIEPGARAGSRLAVRPTRPVKLGRPVEHPLEIVALVEGEAGARIEPAGAAGEWDWPTADGGPLPAIAPPVPPQGPGAAALVAFRQKPWLPRWALGLLAALLVAGVAALLLVPRSTVVPDLTGSRSTLDAQQALARAGLDGRVEPVRARGVPPGTIVGQAPPAGAQMARDGAVTIRVAAGAGRVAAPRVIGLPLAAAEARLREAKLTLGAVQPAVEDAAARVETQIPAAGEVLEEGAAVDVFVASGAGAGGKIAVPAIGTSDIRSYARLAAEQGLVPEKVLAFSATARPGVLFDTVPEGGARVAPGTRVKMLVSVGVPRLAFDDGDDVLLADGASGKRVGVIARSGPLEKDAAFSHDLSKLAYVSGQRIVVVDRERPRRSSVPVTPRGGRYSDPAFAPTGGSHVLAANRFRGADGDLCLGELTARGYDHACFADPSFSTSRVIRWAPDGRSLFVFGAKLESGSPTGVFGMVRYRTRKPFSPRVQDWSRGEFVTDHSHVNRGAIDLAISPDGERMAVVANVRDEAFELHLTRPDDFRLANARRVGVRACKAAWRPDSLEVVVVRSDNCNSAPVGDLLRVDVRHPRRQVSLKVAGDNPAFEPLPAARGR